MNSNINENKSLTLEEVIVTETNENKKYNYSTDTQNPIVIELSADTHDKVLKFLIIVILVP